MVDVIGTLIRLVIVGTIGGIFVWLAAKALKAPRASYWHGILAVVFTILITDILRYLIGGFGWLWAIEFMMLLLLIKCFFGVGWLKAILIAILAAVWLITMIYMLSLMGIVLNGFFPAIP